MMRFLGMLLGLVILPIASVAQTVPVRSGDHENFTRLVFNLPAQLNWTLTNETDRASLRFARTGLNFDTSTVFQRIRRDRVADIQVDSETSSVIVQFGCACRAEAFWFDRTMLVVDVAPREVADDLVSEQSAGAESKQQPGLKSELVRLALDRPMPSARLFQRELNSIGSGSRAASVDAKPSSAKTSDVVLKKTRDELLQQLGRAASQGLLSPRQPSPKSTASLRPTTDHDAPVKPVAVPGQSSPIDRKPKENVHINVRTSVDRDFLETLAGRDANLLTGNCLDQELIDVASWGTDEPFWAQIGPLRAEMTGEFDRVERSVTLELAKRYIYFGFGLEASQVIDMLPQDDPAKQVLSALAQIMQDGEAPGSILNAQLDCEAPIALWSALSHANISEDFRLDKDGIIRGFSALPPHLRLHLGPVLSMRFLEAGLDAESAMILRILDRNEETKSPAAELVAADLDVSQGAETRAEERLSSVVEANAALSPEALLRQVNGRIERGEDVSFDIAQLAGAYAFEYDGTDLGADLSRAHVMALGASGAFDQAFAELDRLAQESVSGVVNIRADLAARLATHAQPMEFLKHVLAGSIGDIDHLSQPTVLRIAEQLLDAGFYDQAQRSLSRAFNGSASRQARLLRARAALADERPRQAEVELLGLTGHDANLLRARARSMSGEHKQAYELFKSAGLEEEAEREAWLADDWSSLATETIVEQADTQNEEGASPNPLAENRALLGASAETRDELQSLLSSMPLPDQED